METRGSENFIKIVEKTIDPAEVSDLFFFQRFKKLVPEPVFRKALIRMSRKTPYMGFVIDPYCLFLFFRLKDVEKAESMLPQRYKLAKSSIFADDPPDYYCGFGCFNTRASTMWGTRLESYLIAEDTKTGLLSFVFIDILSNTIIALPSRGIADPNSRNPVFTTSSKGELFLEVKEHRTDRQVQLKGNLKNGKSRKLDQPLWLMGNTSIAHSTEITGSGDDPFAVIFDPSEVEEALDIPVDDIILETNSLFPGLGESEPSKIVCFPFSQHYVADSPGSHTRIRDRADMVEKYNAIAEMKKIDTISPASTRRQFIAGILASSLSSAVLLVWLILVLLEKGQ